MEHLTAKRGPSNGHPGSGVCSNLATASRKWIRCDAKEPGVKSSLNASVERQAGRHPSDSDPVLVGPHDPGVATESLRHIQGCNRSAISRGSRRRTSSAASSNATVGTDQLRPRSHAAQLNVESPQRALNRRLSSAAPSGLPTP
eukprot:5830651-Pyramimonas_sp.AAC.1